MCLRISMNDKTIENITLNEGIKIEPRPNCPLCDRVGVVLYENIIDKLFNAPGKWNYKECTLCQCAWLDPKPIDSDLHKIYQNYYTHKTEQASIRNKIRDLIFISLFLHKPQGYSIIFYKLIKLVKFIPWIGKSAEIASMGLLNLKAGKILDVGCGSGRVLELYKKAGWEVEGLEADELAVTLTSNRLKIKVMHGSIETEILEENTYDAITLNHVFEHISNPDKALQNCLRALKPGGILSLLTPNFSSLSRSKFGPDWYVLHPQHLILYSPGSLLRISKKHGFMIIKLVTSHRLIGIKSIFYDKYYPNSGDEIVLIMQKEKNDD
jgi:2-polyprenyl-3-methyl-5-hydroxy-6-metoxy-1,4-benzoquinol methylase